MALHFGTVQGKIVFRYVQHNTLNRSLNLLYNKQQSKINRIANVFAIRDHFYAGFLQ